MRFHKIISFIFLFWCFSVVADRHTNVAFGQVIVTENDQLRMCLEPIWADDISFEDRQEAIREAIDFCYDGNVEEPVIVNRYVGNVLLRQEAMAIQEYLITLIPPLVRNSSIYIIFNSKTSIEIRE